MRKLLKANRIGLYINGLIALLLLTASYFIVITQSSGADNNEPDPAKAQSLVAGDEKSAQANSKDEALKKTFVNLHNGGATTKLEIKEGDFFKKLPILKKEEFIFNGWWTDQKDGERIRFSDTFDLSKTDLYAKWVDRKTYEDQAKPGIPVLMYHMFYKGVKKEVGINWFDSKDFEKQLKYLAEKKTYFPSWEELIAYIDGDLALPENSVILTDDDATKSFHELAQPLITKYKVPVTSFVIAIWDCVYKSPYIISQSHTYDMHKAGKSGKGQIMDKKEKTIIIDANKAKKKLLKETKDKNGNFIGLNIGKINVLAFPYGHYNGKAKRSSAKAGIELAFSTVNGRVYPGMDKLQLPRVRVSDGESWEAFLNKVN